jgi:16S rRNA (adenine1518-N6/adenine1519-N6)-dimethyltransferase
MPSSRNASAAAEPGDRGPDLTSPRVVRDLLRRHGLAADTSLGQHFLIDRATLTAIVGAADLTQRDEVWEVGPGLGTLTVELARRAGRVIAIELDRRLLPVLAETLAPWPHAEVRHADALRVDFATAAPGAAFVANLPYQVGTAVLSRVLSCGRFARAVVLVQKEVAERLVATAGSPAYGSLSLWVAHHARARIVRSVPAGAFLPPPKVTSAVVRLDVDPAARPDPATFGLIRDGFRHRRKTLVANLRAVGDDPSDVQRALEELGFDPRARAEVLDLAAFRRLAHRLRARPVPGPRAA